jgi:CheY-like chemotaxis protein
MNEEGYRALPNEALLRVLHLEDSPHDAELVARALDASGVSCSITRVTTEHELEAALAKGTFDIVLSDYGLASFDGMDALRCVRKRAPDLPFIVLSGSIREETAAEMKKLGARDCVSKDDLTVLGSAVRRALSNR